MRTLEILLIWTPLPLCILRSWRKKKNYFTCASKARSGLARYAAVTFHILAVTVRGILRWYITRYIAPEACDVFRDLVGTSCFADCVICAVSCSSSSNNDGERAGNTRRRTRVCLPLAAPAWLRLLQKNMRVCCVGSDGSSQLRFAKRQPRETPFFCSSSFCPSL